jgi:ArsR family transcriptional regulator
MVHVLAGTTEMTVTDLAETLLVRGRHVSQPLVSWHLTILRRVGLVRTRRYGRQVYCSLDTARYQLCLRLLGDLVAPRGPVDPLAGVSGTHRQPSADVLGARQRP